MKTQFLTLAALLVCLSSCSKKEELPECLGSCTIVTGRLLTSGSAALPNAPVTLQWIRPIGLFSEMRKKAIGITGANGRFSVKCFLANDELSSGYLEISYQVDKSKYYTIGEPESAFFNFKRDTILIAPDFLIPRKAFVKLIITNASQIPGSYSFTSDFNSCYGGNTVFSQKIQGGGASINWSGLPT